MNYKKIYKNRQRQRITLKVVCWIMGAIQLLLLGLLGYMLFNRKMQLESNSVIVLMISSISVYFFLKIPSMVDKQFYLYNETEIIMPPIFFRKEQKKILWKDISRYKDGMLEFTLYDMKNKKVVALLQRVEGIASFKEIAKEKISC